MKPVLEACDVDIDDISVFENGAIGNPVTNDVVHTRANRFRIAMITKRRRLRLVRKRKIIGEEFIRVFEDEAKKIALENQRVTIA